MRRTHQVGGQRDDGERGHDRGADRGPAQGLGVLRPGEPAEGDQDQAGADEARAQCGAGQALAEQHGEDDQDAEVEVLDDPQRPAEEPQLAGAER